MSNHRTPLPIAERALALLRTPEAAKLSFTSTLGQAIEVRGPVAADGKVPLRITSRGGVSRPERWDLAKVASSLEDGFIFPVIDGIVHDDGFAEQQNARLQAALDDLATTGREDVVLEILQNAFELAGRRADLDAARAGANFSVHNACVAIAALLAVSLPDDQTLGSIFPR